MAIDGMTYSPREVNVTIAEEGTFGTADTSGTGLAEFESISIDHGLTMDVARKNRGKNPMFYTGDSYISQTGGIRTITLNGVVHRKTDIADFLYAVFQNVTEGGASVYVKDFEGPEDNATDQPDFASDEGYFASIIIDKYLDNFHEIYKSCICTDLTLSFDLVGGDGRLRSSSTWISGFNAAITEASETGDSPASQTYFDCNQFDNAQYNTNDIVIYSGEVHIQNFGKRTGGASATGECNSYQVWKPELLFEGSLTVKYDSNTAGIKGDYIAGTARSMTFGWSPGSGDGEIFFNINSAIITGCEDVDQDDAAAITFSFKSGMTADPYAPSIVVGDSVDRSW